MPVLLSPRREYFRAHDILRNKLVDRLRMFFEMELEHSYLNDEDDVLVVVVVHHPKNRREEVDGLIRPPRTIENLVSEW